MVGVARTVAQGNEGVVAALEDRLIKDWKEDCEDVELSVAASHVVIVSDGMPARVHAGLLPHRGAHRAAGVLFGVVRELRGGH